jgi:hypothetical protein
MNYEKRERRESGGALDADLQYPAAIPLGADGPMILFRDLRAFRRSNLGVTRST